MNQPRDGQPHGSRAPEPNLADVESAVSGSSTLRLAVNTLAYMLPADLMTGSMRQTLDELRNRLDERDLRAIRKYGPASTC
jgi:hypothetical protein